MRPTALGGAVVLAGFGLLVVVLLVLSLSWPLIQDAPVMHCIAWRIGEGDVPYRDLYDINQPGVCVLHLALLARPWGAVAAASAALGFAAYHLAGGAWQAGQRDYLMCVFLVTGALGVVCWLERRGGALSLRGAWLALGAAVGLKPYAVLLAGAFGIVVLVAAVGRREAADGIRSMAAYVAGALVVPVALGTWLALVGGLRAWVDVILGYALPVYGHLKTVGAVARSSLARLDSPGHRGRRRAHRRRGHAPGDARHLVAALGIVYGVVNYVGQSKGSEYHLYPLLTVVCLLAFSALKPALTAGRPWLNVTFTVALASALILVATKGLEASDAPWIWDKERRVRVLVDDLSRGMAPGDAVQVLDIADGGLQALLRLHVGQPTRFLYDVFFFDEADRPVVLRPEFVTALEARPPRFIVLMRGWPSGDDDRIRHFPALAELLARRYDVVVTRDGHRLYARRGA